MTDTNTGTQKLAVTNPLQEPGMCRVVRVLNLPPGNNFRAFTTSYPSSKHVSLQTVFSARDLSLNHSFPRFLWGLSYLPIHFRSHTLDLLTLSQILGGHSPIQYQLTANNCVSVPLPCAVRLISPLTPHRMHHGFSTLKSTKL